MKIKNYIPVTGIATYVFLFLILFSIELHAQNSTRSPYSRFAVGDLTSTTFTTNLGMGGTEIGFNQPLQINCGNPAANAGLSFTTYDGAINFKQYDFSTTQSRHKTNSSSVSYFDMAFPIKRQKWSVGFGLQPYSKIGYAVTTHATNQFGDDEISQYLGSGGLNNFHISTAFQASKKLSFGLNSEYLFGVMDYSRIVGYSSLYYYSTSIRSTTSVGWFHFNFGTQLKFDSLALAKSDSIVFFERKISSLQGELDYLIRVKPSGDSTEAYLKKNQLAQDIALNKLLKKNVVIRRKKTDWRFVMGIVAAPSIDLHARNSSLINSFKYSNFGTNDVLVYVRDTVIRVNGDKSYVRLPLKVGYGFTLQKGSRWLFGSDITFQEWSNFSFLGKPDSLDNSWRISAGVQFVPDERSKNFTKKMQYRLGFHYDSGYLKLNGLNISEAALSAGLGIPVRKAGTLLNLAFEAGRRGTTKNNLILERYFNLTIGFTINDLWFVKSKYD